MWHNDTLADKDLVPTSVSWVFQESCKKILSEQKTSVFPF